MTDSRIFGANVDLCNAFTADIVLPQNPTYAGAALNQWRVPTTIVTARVAKFSVQIDFCSIVSRGSSRRRREMTAARKI